MRRILFLFFVLFLSFSSFAQIEVKPGSFKEVSGFVNINHDENYQFDDNNLPFAVIKVRTENISDKQRRELLFESNMAVGIVLEYHTGEVWVYLTAKYADYLKISHPEFSSMEFTLPCDLLPKHGYEMTLVNKAVPINSGWCSLTVNTKPENGAKILLNGRDFDATTPYSNNMIPSGKYEITVSKDRYKTVTEIVDIGDGDNKTVEIVMPIDVAVITLTADTKTSVYMDGEYKNNGTWSGELKSGNYEIVYKKQYHHDAKQIITVEGGEPKTYELKPMPIFGEISVNSEPSNTNIIIDGRIYGVTPAKINDIIIGPHELRLEKYGCGTVVKQFVLEEGKLLSINETLPVGCEISISTDGTGDKIFVDGNYIGDSPLTTSLNFNEHEITAIRGYDGDINTIDDGKLTAIKAINGVKTATKMITMTQSGNNTSVKLAIGGAIKGVFSVSSSIKVQFSQGNLQYQASTNTWRFADNQWDFIGEANKNISSDYSGWIDLFGWGTSGTNNRSPWMTTDIRSYYGKNSDISGTNYDWGVKNIISNGGGKSWRTLTRDEWVYVFDTRSTSSGIRYAMANVNGVNGLILLPDNWNCSNYSLSDTNDTKASFNSNSISQSDWQNKFESNGAVFLPAAGIRNDTNVRDFGSQGLYWSASYYSRDGAYGMYFNDKYIKTDGWSWRSAGQSVRLVCPAEN